MPRVLVLGAGKIGTLITGLLAEQDDYVVHVADVKQEAAEHVLQSLKTSTVSAHQLDAEDAKALKTQLRKYPVDAVISGLPYYCNPSVAAAAKAASVHYFDLTEDVAVTDAVRQVAEGADGAFVPQCGLAPGFISIVANELMTHFDTLQDVKMRVGALPQNPNNALKYSLTWSTEGLINEYGNLCFGIENREPATLMPLQNLETIEIDGLKYEAFNTSGGLGSLSETYEGQVRRMNYKTMRYPGHCALMQLLVNDLKLNEDRATFKKILENAIPRTVQDVVIIYVSVTGYRDEHLIEENYVNKVYPQVIGGRLWSAIQTTTASGVCTVLDEVVSQPDKFHGFVTQESIGLKDFLENRFGKYYAHGGSARESVHLVATGETGYI